MDNNRYLGDILSIDRKGTMVKDDAYSITIDENNNFNLTLYIADPITDNKSSLYYVKMWARREEEKVAKFSPKGALRNYSLCEEEEKNAFCFSFKINQKGDVIGFNIEKKKVQIDLELEHDDVFDIVDEESELCDYICLSNQLAELLYSKRTNGKEFKGYTDDDSEYNLPFPREFNLLLNSYLTKQIYDVVPLIYNVKEVAEYKGNYEMWYYTSTPTKTVITRDYYASFTSPLRKEEDFINLKILNDIFIEDLIESKKENLIEIYREYLDGYIRMKEESLTTGYKRRAV